MSTIDWNAVRKDFPATQNWAYFQSAGMSPIPTPVFETLVEEYRRALLDGDRFWEADVERFNDLRQEIGALLGAERDDVAFLPNTSWIMALLAETMKANGLGEGNIVSLMDEFPSSTVPYEYASFDMRYVESRDHRYSVQDILDKVDDATVAVVCSYVQYGTGFRLDLEKLGKGLEPTNALFIVNATQGLPFFPIDVQPMKIDCLSASLHKWGCTGHVGSIFYTSPSFRERFRSPFAGWLSIALQGEEFIHTQKGVPFELHETAQRYILGTVNFQPLMALRTSLQYFTNIGFEAIRQRIFELMDHLAEGIGRLNLDICTPMGHLKERSAILSVRIPGDASALAKQLEEKGIMVAARKGRLRISINIFNNHEDIDRLLNQLPEVLAGTQ
jgi:selenocysteine lyase/cysteine desulfurase